MPYRLGLLAVMLVGGALVGVLFADSPLLALTLFVGIVTAVLVLTLRRSQRGAHQNNRGITLMAEGRLVEAIAAFEAAAKDMGVNPLPPFNVAMTKLWLWRLEESRVGLEKTTTTLRGRPLRQMAAPALLFIAALQNDRAKAVVLEKEIAALQLERSAVVAMGRAVFHAREKRWKDVLDDLTLERTRPLGGPARAVADALRGWALVELGGTCPPLDTVGVFGETGPAALRQWWPEFADFLERVASRPH
ncbi:MAG: hypothetical protein ACOZQL_22450 [Myxococcota bacterium]